MRETVNDSQGPIRGQYCGVSGEPWTRSRGDIVSERSGVIGRVEQFETVAGRQYASQVGHAQSATERDSSKPAHKVIGCGRFVQLEKSGSGEQQRIADS